MPASFDRTCSNNVERHREETHAAGKGREADGPAVGERSRAGAPPLLFVFHGLVLIVIHCRQLVLVVDEGTNATSPNPGSPQRRGRAAARPDAPVKATVEHSVTSDRRTSGRGCLRWRASGMGGFMTRTSWRFGGLFGMYLDGYVTGWIH
jgi:hypothetical protein